MKQFRAWLEELWRENCDEHDAYHEPRYTIQEYFSRYKYWLKREYRHQQGVKRGS
jgi:hypothetical protein